MNIKSPTKVLQGKLKIRPIQSLVRLSDSFKSACCVQDGCVLNRCSRDKMHLALYLYIL